MAHILIIGAGGVGSVVAHKCGQVMKEGRKIIVVEPFFAHGNFCFSGKKQGKYCNKKAVAQNACLWNTGSLIPPGLKTQLLYSH